MQIKFLHDTLFPNISRVSFILLQGISCIFQPSFCVVVFFNLHFAWNEHLVTWAILLPSFFKCIFGSLEFQIGSLESEKIIIGSLKSENRVPRIREIRSLQIHTELLTLSLKKTCCYHNLSTPLDKHITSIRLIRTEPLHQLLSGTVHIC